VRRSGGSNTKPDGGIETSFSLAAGFRLPNCVPTAVIAIKSFRFQIVFGLVPLVEFVMTGIIMRPKTSETKELEYSSRQGMPRRKTLVERM
jgi:hypothetical protein